MTPKAQATKEKIEKLNFIKMKDFYASKDPIKKVKSKWEKMLQIICLVRTAS